MQLRRPLVILVAVTAIGAAALMLSRKKEASPVASATNPPGGVLGSFEIPPPPKLTDPLIRPELKEALGTVAPLNYRTDLIRALPARSLRPVEIDAMLAAMVQRPVREQTVVHSTFMHQIACILHLYPDIRERFARALATLARDTQRDSSTRDYAIQHLRTIWSDASGDPALRTAIVATFHEFAESNSMIAPSGLLSLHILHSTPNPVKPAQSTAKAASQPYIAPVFHIPDSYFAPILERIFSEKTSTANIATKMTALRIVNERRLSAFRQPLLAALQDRNEHMMVRLAAVSALGKITDAADLPALAAITPNDTRVATALQSALNSRSFR